MQNGLIRTARAWHGLTFSRQRRHRMNGSSSRLRQRGSLSEMAIAIPVLLLLGLSTLQGSLIYHGKSTLNYATFEAARTGAVHHGQEGAMRHELGIRLAPLQGGDGSTERAATAILMARTLVENRLQTRIRIVNPTADAFSDWGFDDPDSGELMIPNSHLRHQPNSIGSTSGVTLRDANLLKIEVTHGLELKVPLVGALLAKTLMLFDPENTVFYAQNQLPLKSVATVRMQSPAWKSAITEAADHVAVAESDSAALIEEGDTDGAGEGNDPTGEEEHGGDTSDEQADGSDDGDDLEPTDGSDQNDGDKEEDAEDEIACETSWDDERYQSADEGNWWNPLDWGDEIKAAAAVVWDFFSGLVAGMGEQVSDLLELIKDPSVMLDIAKAFIDDPKGVIEGMLTELGADVDKLMQCGPGDIGQLVGQSLNPALAIRIVGRLAGSTRLGRYADDLEAREVCASFPAGTPIWTPEGSVFIEVLKTGDVVDARDEQTLLNAPQRITATHGRVAEGYHRIETELGVIEATSEHPFWVQGKGWVEAKAIAWEDPIATASGDVVAYSNTYVEEATPVFNFSVESTPSYFAGEMGLWVHNAGPCRIPWTQPLPNFPNVTLRGIRTPNLFTGSPTRTQSLLRDRMALHYNLQSNSNLPSNARWQAHHVIPFEFRNNPMLNRLGIDINSIDNGIPLPCSSGTCSAIHNGSHSRYSAAVRQFLQDVEKMNVSDSVKRDVLIRGIEESREGLAKNNPPLRNSDGATVQQWNDVFNDVLEEYAEET
ncbi:AHH domain-containing protein [Granulosicoccus antarcticus]|uniref:TadE-like domain-containing protein n=1 Tax=Granulosicoccus antarcticus IMCC3135 TaxID=1192854 RepID=A0A2Z2NLC2_9GAMM|nr:AHH domain-containing protein [Granulosicoccus antarcticus]ASJ71953.1 hypothetical protein IMCC3135_09280 [Granulosicoccus antarcticus IMCC3135]